VQSVGVYIGNIVGRILGAYVSDIMSNEQSVDVCICNITCREVCPYRQYYRHNFGRLYMYFHEQNEASLLAISWAAT
jgi:hypothetical protein